MNIVLATKALRDGKKVQRVKWSDHVFLETPPRNPVHRLFSAKKAGVVYITQGTVSTPWNPTQEDVFAEDWVII